MNNFKKVFLLIALCFLLCGCNVTVNLKIADHQINEKIGFVYLYNTAETKSYAESVFGEYIPAYNTTKYLEVENNKKKAGVNYYNRQMSNVTNGYYYVYSYQFGYEDYYKSFSTDIALDNFLVACSGDEALKLEILDSKLKVFNTAPDLEKLIINITTAYEVIESNADSVNNGTYTWTITPDTTKKLLFIIKDASYCGGSENSNKLYEEEKQAAAEEAKAEAEAEAENIDYGKTDDESNNQSSQNDKSGAIILLIICIISFIVFAILAIVISKKSKKNNK